MLTLYKRLWPREIDTLTCVKAEATVKKDSDTVAGQEHCTVVDILIEIEVEVLVYAQADTFAQL